MKITSEVTRETPTGKFVMRKHDTIATFFCDHCGKDKTSKSRGIYYPLTGGQARQVCNGCYGELLAK